MWLSERRNGANSTVSFQLAEQKQDILSPLKITPKSDSTTTSKDPNKNKTRQPIIQLLIVFYSSQE